jgi:hypothetical protein
VAPGLAAQAAGRIGQANALSRTINNGIGA